LLIVIIDLNLILSQFVKLNLIHWIMFSFNSHWSYLDSI